MDDGVVLTERVADMAAAVLVAGGTGALGAGVLRALLDAGYPVTATWVVEKELRAGSRPSSAIEAGLTLYRRI